MIQEYSLLYAYVSQYVSGTDRILDKAFQVFTREHRSTGLLRTLTKVQQKIWISRISMVIRNLLDKNLSSFNERLLSNDQIFYACWTNQRVAKCFSRWQSSFLVFKGSNVFFFDQAPSPEFSFDDFHRCSDVYSIIEILIEDRSIDQRPFSFVLFVLNENRLESRYITFERQTEYEDFISNYQRALYLTVYSTRIRSFICIYRQEICRLIIDINKGFQIYQNKTDHLLISFLFEQFHSSSNNGNDKIEFLFQQRQTSNDSDSVIRLGIQCRQLKRLIHVLNAFLIVKRIEQDDSQ